MARYTVHTPDGPKRKLIYGKKYRDVERKLAEARGDAARGIVFDDENLTVEKYLDRWLSDSVRGSVRVSTHERYRQIVRLHIKPVIGRVRLKALTPAHVQTLPEPPRQGPLPRHGQQNPRRAPQGPQAGHQMEHGPPQRRGGRYPAEARLGGDTAPRRRGGSRAA